MNRKAHQKSKVSRTLFISGYLCAILNWWCIVHQLFFKGGAKLSMEDVFNNEESSDDATRHSAASFAPSIESKSSKKDSRKLSSENEKKEVSNERDLKKDTEKQKDKVRTKEEKCKIKDDKDRIKEEEEKKE